MEPSTSDPLHCFTFRELTVCMRACMRALVYSPPPWLNSLELLVCTSSTFPHTSPFQNVNPLYHQPETQHSNPLFAGKVPPPTAVNEDDDLPKKMP